MRRVFAATLVLLTASSVVAAGVLLRRFLFATNPVPLIPAESALIATPSGSGRTGPPRRSGSGLLSATKPPEEESEPRAPDEFERVLSHREQMFRELGFNRWQAVSLAEAGCDWHEAEKLLARDCPHETALDLLLP